MCTFHVFLPWGNQRIAHGGGSSGFHGCIFIPGLNTVRGGGQVKSVMWQEARVSFPNKN